MEDKNIPDNAEVETKEPKLPEEELNKVSGGGIIIRPTGEKPDDGGNLF